MLLLDVFHRYGTSALELATLFIGLVSLGLIVYSLKMINRNARRIERMRKEMKELLQR